MSKKSYILIALIIISINIHAEKNLSISIQNQYNNIIDLNSNELDMIINSNLTKLNATWESNELLLGINLYRENFYINLSNIDTTALTPIEVNNNSIESDYLEYYPELFFNYKDNKILLTLNDDSEISFNLMIPVNRYFYLGLSEDIDTLFDSELDILGSYILDINPKTFVTTGSVKLGNSWIEGGFSLKSITLKNEYDSEVESIIGSQFEIKSDTANSSYLTLMFNSFYIKATVNYSNYLLSENPLYIYHENYLSGGSSTPGDLEIVEGKIESKYKNLSISMSLTEYKLDSFKVFLGTDSFIYGPLAYKSYKLDIPDLILQNILFETKYFIKLSKCSLELGLDYERYYLDLHNLDYDEETRIWNLFSTTLISKEDDIDLPITYNNINLLKLHLNTLVDITEELSIIGSISQIIPFFDKDITTATDKTSEESNSNDTLYGGTTLSIKFKLIL